MRSRRPGCGDDRPVCLTYEHVARDEGEQARVKASGGKISATNRLGFCLEVTRAFGDLALYSMGLIAEPYM